MSGGNSFFFLDWCPRTIAQSLGTESPKPHPIKEDILSQISWLGQPAFDEAACFERHDGIFIFYVKSKNLMEARDAVECARLLSYAIKSEVLNHPHVFHSYENKRPSIYHNPVLLAISNVATSPEDILNEIAKNETSLLGLKAAYKDGLESNRPALLVLRHLHSRKKDDVISYRNINQMSGNTSIQNTLVTWGIAIIAIACFALFMTITTYKSGPDNYKYLMGSLLSTIATSGIILFVLALTIHKTYLMPRRTKIFNCVGYLQSCETYSDVIKFIAKRNEGTAPFEIKMAAYEISHETYRSACASLSTLMQKEYDKIQFEIHLYTGAFTAASAIFACLALI